MVKINNKPIEEQKNLENVDKKKNIKKFILFTFLCFLLVSASAVIVGVIDVFARNIDWNTSKFTIIADSFFVSGAIYTLFWMLVFLSQEGAFDMLIYGVRKCFVALFRRNPEDSTLPKTFFDYVTIKRGKKKKRFFPLLINSSIFLIVGIILSLCAYYL